MLQACQVKKGHILKINKETHSVEKVHAVSPSARGGNTLYKIRTRNVITGQKADHSWKGDEKLEETAFEKRDIQYSYKQGDMYAFMDLEDYSQFELAEESIGDDINFLLEDMELKALIIEDVVRGIIMPEQVELKVIECDPSMKSASATARTKNAKVETGFELQVPEYLECDEVIKIDTKTGKFLSRA